MIRVTRMGGQVIILNSDLIEEIDSVPDTTLLMTTGRRVIVQESAEEVVRRVVAFRQLLATGPATGEVSLGGGEGGPLHLVDGVSCGPPLAARQNRS
jgi:flagellar protein FlbD